MDKQTLIDHKNECEIQCRALFDKLTTMQQEESQLAVELERTRGDFRTYAKILDEWEEPVSTSPHPLFPVRENVTPDNSKSSKKEKVNV